MPRRNSKINLRLLARELAKGVPSCELLARYNLTTNQLHWLISTMEDIAIITKRSAGPSAALSDGMVSRAFAQLEDAARELEILEAAGRIGCVEVSPEAARTSRNRYARSARRLDRLLAELMQVRSA